MTPAAIPETLPSEPEAVGHLVAHLAAAIEERDRFIEQLKHEVGRLRRWQFGTKAEYVPDHQQIFGFYGRLESDREKAAREKEAEPSLPREKKKGHGRRLIPDDLPRVEVVHDIPEAEKSCEKCGNRLCQIGCETAEQLEYHPADVHVLKHVRPKYACGSCESTVRIAEPATGPIAKGLAGPGLLTHVLISKYDDHLPLYRQQEIFARKGVELSRSTLCGWVGECVGLLRPIYRAMCKDVLASKAIRTDDTPVRVLEPGARRTHLGRFWSYLGDPAHLAVVYQFTWTREQKWAKEFLGAYKGYLQADAYPGYDQLYLTGNIIEVACLAHIRRRFFEALETDKERALFMLDGISHLYDIERQAKEQKLTAHEIRALRQERSTPILEQLRAWLDQEVLRVLPKSPIGQAIQYARAQWKALLRYLEDGDLDIDNGACERTIRGIGVGRRNWLFLGSEGGGEWAAVVYSLIESAKLSGHDPYRYLKDVLVRVSSHPMNRIEELMPRLWKPPPDPA